MSVRDPIAWCLVDCHGQPVKWATPVLTNPRDGSLAALPKTADASDPDGAPHAWQPLMPKEEWSDIEVVPIVYELDGIIGQYLNDIKFKDGIECVNVRWFTDIVKSKVVAHFTIRRK